MGRVAAVAERLRNARDDAHRLQRRAEQLNNLLVVDLGLCGVARRSDASSATQSGARALAAWRRRRAGPTRGAAATHRSSSESLTPLRSTSARAPAPPATRTQSACQQPITRQMPAPAVGARTRRRTVTVGTDGPASAIATLRVCSRPQPREPMRAGLGEPALTMRCFPPTPVAGTAPSFRRTRSAAMLLKVVARSGRELVAGGLDVKVRARGAAPRPAALTAR